MDVLHPGVALGTSRFDPDDAVVDRALRVGVAQGDEGLRPRRRRRHRAPQFIGQSGARRRVAKARPLVGEDAGGVAGEGVDVTRLVCGQRAVVDHNLQPPADLERSDVPKRPHAASERHDLADVAVIDDPVECGTYVVDPGWFRWRVTVEPTARKTAP